jgi:nitroreductase
MKVKDIIEKRYSPRAFSGKAVEKEKIESVFEAARSAPSSYNGQPWRFIYATKGEEKFDRIVASLIDFNKMWASNSPVLIVSLAKKTYEHNGAPYHHAAYDLGQSIGFMTIQAFELDLYMHQMGGFDAEKLKESFEISEDYDVLTVTALGYKGNVEDLPEDLQKIENPGRIRKELKEIIW